MCTVTELAGKYIICQLITPQHKKKKSDYTGVGSEEERKSNGMIKIKERAFLEFIYFIEDY